MLWRVRISLRIGFMAVALLCTAISNAVMIDAGVLLARNFSLGSTRQYLVSISMTSTMGSSTSDPTVMNMTLSMTEKTELLNPDGTASIKRSFTPLITDMNGRSIPCRSLPQSTSLTVNRQNHVSKTSDMDLKSLLPSSSPELGWLGLNYGCIVTFPGNQVQPGSSWTSSLNMPKTTLSTPVKHTFVGVETRAGKKTARILTGFDTTLEQMGYPASEGTMGTANVRFTSFIDPVSGDMVEGEGRSESKLVINPPADRGYATQPLVMNCVTTVNIKPFQ